MAKDYRPVDRDQVFLLPPDMRDWVGRDDPVWLVIATVQRMNTASVHKLRKTGGVGRRGYDPDMLLTLLIWAWAHGQRSSRQIERLCHRDLTYRVICAGDVPDHSTIAQFRKDASPVMADLFAESLTVCAQLGMGQLGVVALDGVKIASNASQSANRTEKHLVKERQAEAQQLRSKLKDVGAQSDAEHAANDDDGDGDGGDEIPPGLINAPGAERLARIDAALASAREHNQAARDAKPTQTRAEINRDHTVRRRAAEDAKAQQWVVAYTAHLAGDGDYPGAPPMAAQLQAAVLRLSKARADQQTKIDAWERKPRKRRPPSAVDDHSSVRQARTRVKRAEVLDAQLRARRVAEDETYAAAIVAARNHTRTPHRANTDTRRNITDPQSRALSLRGGGWIQGYNCQAVTSSDGLIIATMVTNGAIDTPHFVPMMNKAVAAAEHIQSHQHPPPDTPGIGLLLADAGYHSEANITAAGPDRLIASTKTHKLRVARAEHSTTETTASSPAQSDTVATPIEAMATRLLTEEGHAAYSRRSHIAETPFGWAKHTLGFRRFTGRGLARANAEFTFHAMVNNICKALTAGHLATT
ncbi:transposase [Gordonia terrae]|uniref:DDE transposase n=2 Tax=Gordonia terrae TaxID=2055 RepID=A0AAD0KDX4_9ACTN|nr:transposase [Gordonia terrae]ANY23563.1 hypothetical protein BCM27_12840 [Gordonia terrae]AWO84296.1 DDE transposase [Gordonia terrae]VTR01788.1 transposase (5' fragment) [Clostridioides difficile]